MDPFAVRRQEILRQQAEVCASFPGLWSRMIEDWRKPGGPDRAWVMYSANYLFRTNDVPWALDPVRLKHRLPQASEIDPARDLSELAFVLLTHQHGDHLDLGLIHSLRHLPIAWIVPQFLLPTVTSEARLSSAQIIVARYMEAFDLHGIRITPFDGLHREHASDATDSKPRGTPAMGYLVEFSHKRWLFPGDTRTYESARLPFFGRVDGVFAHLWLGHGCALQEEPALIDSFCRFYLALRPGRVILTHLREFGRDPRDYWDETHSARTCLRFRQMAPGIPITPALLGESVLL